MRCWADMIFRPFALPNARQNRFLQHMVRNIVGALVYVGNGRHPPAWIAELLAGRDRTRAAPTFAPDGLYLTGIDYLPRWNLPSTHAPVRAFGA